MRVMGFDPSMTCTGWVVLVQRASKILEMGRIRVSSKDDVERVSELHADALTLMDQYKPDAIVIETPAKSGRRREHWGYDGRSPLTAPVYGMAVSAVITAAAVYKARQMNREITVIGRPADQWTRNMPSTKDDEHKRARVQMAARVLGVDEGQFGKKSTAGDIADAALLTWMVGQTLDPGSTVIPGTLGAKP